MTESASYRGIAAARSRLWTWLRLLRPRYRRSFWWHLIPSTGVMVSFSLLLAAFTIRIADPPLVESMRVKTFDLFQSLSPRPIAQHPVAIIDLDEKSLSAYGQWPWPRTLVAELIDKLGAAGVAVVGFDVVFAEYDRMSPEKIAEVIEGLSTDERNSLKALPSNENVMAEAMRRTKTVLGQVGLQTYLPPGRADTTIKSPVRAMAGGDPSQFLEQYVSLLSNIPELEAAAAGHGIFSLGEEKDGKVRRVPLIVRIGDAFWPTLSVEMLRAAFGNNTLITRRNAAGMESVQLQIRQELGGGNFIIPTDAKGRLWVHFSRPDGFNTTGKSGRLYISAADVLRNRVPAEKLRGKFVIVGTSAVGLKDLRDTAVANRMPGVEVHANILEQIFSAEKSYAAAVLQQIAEFTADGAQQPEAARYAVASIDKRDFFLRYPNYSNSAELFLTLIAGFALMALIPRLGPMLTLAVMALTAPALIGFAWYLYKQKMLLLDVTYPGITIVALYMVLTFSNYTREAAEKKQVRSAFGQYLSPTLVEQLAANPDQLMLGGEAKKMTFLFCDVRDFTSISETYKIDPQALTMLMNRLLTPLSDAIMANSGTIDKYMGDCVMAFWNAPVDVEDHEYHACSAALDMLSALDQLNRERRLEAWDTGIEFLPLRVGVGINTGDCVVGNMGSAQRFDYSVLGDSVNLAARLEALSKDYGVTILIGEETAARVADRYPLLELDLITVKGKTEAVTLYGLIDGFAKRDDASFGRLIELNGRMLAAYRAQDWQTARVAATKCAAIDRAPTGLYTLYQTRIGTYERAPPGPDWNGVTISDVK